MARSKTSTKVVPVGTVAFEPNGSVFTRQIKDGQLCILIPKGHKAFGASAKMLNTANGWKTPDKVLSFHSLGADDNGYMILANHNPQRVLDVLNA